MKDTIIYLDYNASAPLHPEARDAMMRALDCGRGALNASAVHHYGRQGRKIVEDARRDVAALIGAQTNQVLFNSGATEGNNTIINHFSRAYPEDMILISAVEHPSILELTQHYDNIKTIPVDENGLVRADILEEMLKAQKTSLVSCVYAHNETGAIQNVSLLCQISHKNGALFHSDATQAAGRLPLNIQNDNIDFLTISSHKIGGPQGVGALILGQCGQTPTLLYGGGQEKSARAGTENIAGIAGFGAAAKQALADRDHYAQLYILRDKIESAIKATAPETVFHAENAVRLANTTFFSLPKGNAQSLLMAFDLEGIAISNGSACSSGTVKPSATLNAMGVKHALTKTALRVSLGRATCESDIDAFIKAWEKIYLRIKA